MRYQRGGWPTRLVGLATGLISRALVVMAGLLWHQRLGYTADTAIMLALSVSQLPVLQMTLLSPVVLWVSERRSRPWSDS